VILVTGATGFVGHHLVRRLLAAGEAVRCFVRPGSSRADWLASQKIETTAGHLHDPASVTAACRGIRAVIHLAAPTREVRDAVVGQFHQQATRCLVDGARRAGIDRFMMVSPLGSGSSAGFPYLRSRGTAEDCVRESGLPFVILQSSLMFGAGDRLVGGIIRLLRRTGLLVIPGTGKTMVQPIWVGDIVSCLVRALRDDSVVDRTILIGGPQHLSYEEMAEQIGTMLNIPRMKIHISRRAVGLVGRLLEGLARNPFLAYRHLELLDVGTITGLDAVKRTFGFQPMPLVEGVAYQLTSQPELGPPWITFRADRGSGTRSRYRV
jgi:uncharacterized protein YbjT (DUF2867 family)